MVRQPQASKIGLIHKFSSNINIAILIIFGLIINGDRFKLIFLVEYRFVNKNQEKYRLKLSKLIEFDSGVIMKVYSLKD